MQLPDGQGPGEGIALEISRAITNVNFKQSDPNQAVVHRTGAQERPQRSSTRKRKTTSRQAEGQPYQKRTRRAGRTTNETTTRQQMAVARQGLEEQRELTCDEVICVHYVDRSAL